jgi:signal transduction histidine kinase
MTNWLVRLVARAPFPVQAKLLAALLAMVALLITVGAVGLVVLSAANRRDQELIRLQKKIAAYRQLQYDTTAQLYSVTSSLLVSDEPKLAATLRQLDQVGLDFARLQFIADDEAEVLDQIKAEHDQFTQTVTRVIELIRAGKLAEGRELQLTQTGPLVDDLERLINQLVNRAEAEILAQTEANRAAYATSRWVIIGFAVGSIALALVLGYAISWSLIGPVQRMDMRLREIASGDFSGQVEVPNRDELGDLAANLNRMNVELGRLYYEVQTASRHKSEFLANMSHELRTPLNAIIGFSEVLLERMFGDLNAKQDEYLQDILSSGRHLLSLINDILDLSKIEAGRMELELGVFSLPEVLENSLTMVRERASSHAITLGLNVGPGLGPVEADERKVKQVLFNLLSNAVKFTPDGGRVEVTAHPAGEAVAIAVRDTGIGIAPEDQERIFDEFRQVSGDTGKQEGTGLGLALTRRFVELHGGSIRVESRVGEGSTFTVTLPLRRSPAGEPVGAESALPDPSAADGVARHAR